MGRPRDPGIDRRILRETRRQLRKHGYRGLRVAAVAAGAGVTAPTLRLRWPTKAELVHDAVFTDTDDPAVPETGSLIGDVTEAVRVTVARYSTPEMKAAVFGLAEDVRSDPELRSRIDRRLRQPAMNAFSALLERAVASGQIDVLPQTSAETLLDVIAGTVVMRVLRNDESAEGWQLELVDLLLRGVGTNLDGASTAAAGVLTIGERRAKP
jgi:AcrR family transcriptional regulator